VSYICKRERDTAGSLDGFKGACGCGCLAWVYS
jgi:hypothetical protein